VKVSCCFNFKQYTSHNTQISQTNYTKKYTKRKHVLHMSTITNVTTRTWKNTKTDCRHAGSVKQISTALRIYISLNSTWLVTSRLDTFDVSSPCILAVSSLELVEQHGSTRSTQRARLARHVERDETRRNKPSGIWATEQNNVFIYRVLIHCIQLRCFLWDSFKCRHCLVDPCRLLLAVLVLLCWYVFMANRSEMRHRLIRSADRV